MPCKSDLQLTSKDLQESMHLVCIAHLGEAQALIKGLSLQKVNNEIYHRGELYLLITGEGPWEVLTTLPYIIAKYSITSLLNLGIAGSLSPKVKQGLIYPIRTCYAYRESSPRFNSYSTRHQQSTLDCITTEDRVLDNTLARELSNFADIVDREVWAVGRVAQKYNIPFESYKLISDIAGDKTQCFDLKNRAPEFSQKILKFYLELEKKSESVFDLDLSFHASFTQEKKIKKLAQMLDIEMREIEKTYQVFRQQNPQINHKKVVNLLIKDLEVKINPLNSAILTTFKKLNSPFESIGAELQFSPNLDKKQFTLKMNINSQKNITNLISELNKLDYKQFEKLWDGDFHVP